LLSFFKRARKFIGGRHTKPEKDSVSFVKADLEHDDRKKKPNLGLTKGDDK